MVSNSAAVAYRPIDGFPGYRVGDDGSVWSQRYRNGQVSGEVAWRRLNPTPIGRAGHKQLKVSLRREGRTSQHYVHRLVLLAFVGPCPPGFDCCHFDGNPFNNHLANLRWDTRKANCADTIRHGRTPRGERNGMSKLTAHIVRLVRAEVGGGKSQSEVATIHGLSLGTVNDLVNRRSWKHID
jgi:hypothetical protein